MTNRRYIQVILPIRLEWEPLYFIDFQRDEFASEGQSGDVDVFVNGIQKKNEVSASGNEENADVLVDGVQVKADSPLNGIQGKCDATVNENTVKADAPVNENPEKADASVNENTGKADATASGNEGKADSPLNGIQGKCDATVNGNPKNADAPVKIGDRVRVCFANRNYHGVVSNADAAEIAKSLNASRIKSATLAPELESVTAEEIELWRQVASYYLCTVGEVLKAAYPASKIASEESKAKATATMIERLKAGISRNEALAAKFKKEERRNEYLRKKSLLESQLEELMFGIVKKREYSETVPLTLSEAQQEAFSSIKQNFKEKKPVLLEGITGSGKTEIYLKLAQETLAAGKNVLYLVPEIALSRQLEDRIAKVFPDILRVFHSAETATQREATAKFIKNGAYVVLGTRSAIFLPHKDLGLVIVDEEHDNSYKQTSPAPRYNGRETAIMLSNIFKANIILGSATPSLESLYNCSVGRFELVKLKKRFYNAEDSDIEIIDTSAERRKNGMIGNLSRKLIKHIQETLVGGEQTVILRERRAYSAAVQCCECGDIPKCKSCNVPLSLHMGQDGSSKLVCHYCGRVYEYSGKCPKCGGTMKSISAGTQKIEEEIKNLFPEARVERLDGDSAKKKSYEEEVIKDFENGKIDILVGTRIVSKGFDFSGLTLVAVIQADSLLGQDSFRADEWARQLLEQFRGRCGRREKKGLFVIQTAQPEHPVYKHFEDSLDNDDLQRKLMSERKLFCYPPYSRVIELEIKDYSAGRCDEMSQALADALMGGSLPESVRVTGPYSPSVDRVAGLNIRKIRLLLPKDKFLKANKTAIVNALAGFEKEKKYPGHVSLDVDPV